MFLKKIEHQDKYQKQYIERSGRIKRHIKEITAKPLEVSHSCFNDSCFELMDILDKLHKLYVFYQKANLPKKDFNFFNDIEDELPLIVERAQSFLDKHGAENKIMESKYLFIEKEIAFWQDILG